MPNFKVIASSIALVLVIIGATFSFNQWNATKADVAEVQQFSEGNLLIILYTQLDRQLAEKRLIEDKGQRVPQSLIESINQKRRDIRKREKDLARR